MRKTKKDIENRFKKARRIYNESKELKTDEITLTKLAKIADYKDKSIFSKLETGKATPTLDHVKLYHEQFGVTMEYLIGENESMHHENVRVGSDLGVTDAVADTMVMLKNRSSNENDFTSVLNAFIGNNEATFGFINTLLTYLYLDFTDNQKNSSVYDTLMTTTVINYINQYVKPQLQSILEAKHQILEKHADIPTSQEDYDIVRQMVDSCYKDNRL